MTNHKKLLIGCGCALLVIALVIGLVVIINNGAGNNTNLPSDGTTEATGPDGTTQGTTPDGTEPSGTDATEPSSGTDETVPHIDLTEPTTEPTEPTYTYPTEPNGDVIPVDPNEGTTTTPTTPPVVTPVDLGGVTVDTITTEIFNNWSGEQRRAFLEYFFANEDNMTLDQRYYVYQQTQHNGWLDEELMSKGIYVSSEKAYEKWLAQKELGCTYCADTDCVAFYARSETGITEYDETKCPYYNEEYDPSIYCQECGYKKLNKCDVGETGCSRVITHDAPCSHCGEMKYLGKCHHCVKKEN